MTSERPRFPVGLTLAAAVVIAVCAGLGFWQLQRLKWKEGVLVHIAALRRAPAQTIAPVLARIAKGEDVSFTRVAAACGPGSRAAGYRISSDHGDWIARPQALCRIGAAALTLDRGLLLASRGQTSAPTAVLPAPNDVEGFLRPSSAPDPGRVQGYLLVVEHENPPPPGVVPDPGADQAPENLQYAGAYAPTWFGLAGVAACFYAAMLWRRYRPSH